MPTECADDPGTPDESEPHDVRTTVVDPSLPEDAVLLLGDPRHRLALATLSGFADDASVSELARVMCVEAELREADYSLPPAETLAISLHHAHLPKLADADLVAYDTETRRVVATDRAKGSDAVEGVDRLLTALDG